MVVKPVWMKRDVTLLFLGRKYVDESFSALIAPFFSFKPSGNHCNRKLYPVFHTGFTGSTMIISLNIMFASMAFQLKFGGLRKPTKMAFTGLE